MRKHHNTQPTKKVRTRLLKEKKIENLKPSPLKGRCPEKGELIFLFQRPYQVKFVNAGGTDIRLGLVPEELRAMADEVMAKAEKQYAEMQAQSAVGAVKKGRKKKVAPSISVISVINEGKERLEPGDAVVIDDADGGVIGLPGIPIKVRRPKVKVVAHDKV
jgi:hypothetical protein